MRAAREAVPNTPILVGSGVDPDQCASLAPLCDGLIVGTWIKHGGDWRNPVDPARVARLREALQRCT